MWGRANDIDERTEIVFYSCDDLFVAGLYAETATGLSRAS